LFPKKAYKFRFIDNPPSDPGVTVGKGNSYYFGTDAMLECKFPPEYKVVSVSTLFIYTIQYILLMYILSFVLHNMSLLHLLVQYITIRIHSNWVGG
jgi:hypothetical protein